MNKEAAARIAAVVRSTGLPVVHAAALVKAAHDRELAARMEKDAFFGKLIDGAQRLGQRFAPRMLGGRVGPPPVRANPLPRVPTSVPVPAAPAPAGTAGAFGYNPARAAQAQALQLRPRGVAPPSAPSRWRFNPVKATAALGAGTVGWQHASNNADNTVGRSANPFTWFGNANTEEDVFRHNQAGYDAARSGIQSEMDAALAGGDMQKYTELNERFQRGDFGGPQSPGLRMNNGQVERTGNWNPFKSRMFGLNPWAEETGAAHQRRMLSAQSSLQGKYDTELGKSGPQPGDAEQMRALRERLQAPDLLPQQAQAMQRQLDALQARMSQPPGTPNGAANDIRARMERAGMRFTGPARPAAPAGPQPMSGAWNLGGRPRIPGYMSGAAMLPSDFRPPAPLGQWDQVIGQNSPFPVG